MTLALLLLQIAVILAACRLMQGLAQRLAQPPVMGEIIAGILLGQSFFGWVAPSWYAHLFPPDSLPALHGLSQIGLVLFMFLVGLRLDLSELTAFRRIAGVSGLLSILVPFCAGLALASPLRTFAPPPAPSFQFSLFIAVSISITAFPVLARILDDHGLRATNLGHIAVACAAFGDVVAWTMLAWITAISRSGYNGASFPGPLGAVAIYVIVMLGPVRVVLRTAVARYLVLSELPVVCVFLLLSSWITETAGLHALFGAFLAGVVWPRQGIVIETVAAKFEPVAMMVLMPLFFAYTGIRANLAMIHGATLWSFELLIIAVAVAAKIGGAFTGALLTGYGARDSLALGTLMNTRGLVELVVLNVGLDLGILSPALFSMLVTMALATTLMTSPLLSLILPPEKAIRRKDNYER